VEWQIQRSFFVVAQTTVLLEMIPLEFTYCGKPQTINGPCCITTPYNRKHTMSLFEPSFINKIRRPLLCLTEISESQRT